MKYPKITALALSLLSAPAFAKTIGVHVNGMVCSFCGQGITKKFASRPEVKKVEVSLKDKIVKLELEDKTDIPDEEIQKILKESGYQVEKIAR